MKLRATSMLILLAAVLVVLVYQAQFVNSQTSNDLTALSYLAFSQLATVYQSGGKAPDLVAKLNLAVGMIQDARVKRAQGDIVDATNLELNARSLIQSVLTGIPAAQAEAAHDSADREITAIALVVVAVISSTLLFYVSLRTWRHYEKMKLYEMNIIEKKTEA